MITLRKKATRPPHMAGHMGDVSMWTTESADGVRRVHIRCPHCDGCQTFTRIQLKVRWRWMRAASRWLRAGRRMFL